MSDSRYQVGLQEILQLCSTSCSTSCSSNSSKQGFEYSQKISVTFDKIADIICDLIESNISNDSKINLITKLEENPLLCEHRLIPRSLDLIYRSDGHGFSKFLKPFKNVHCQPFLLDITNALNQLVVGFEKMNEFKKKLSTYYLCSDEITGLSPHGEICDKVTSYEESNILIRSYTGQHPFSGKINKTTSMIASTISANFSPLMRKAVDPKLFDEICEKRKSYPTFDARVFASNRKLVGMMFISRVRSCYRNTVSEFHDYFFGTKSGFKMNSTEKIKHMRDVYQYDFEGSCPPCLKYGIYIKGDVVIVPLTKPSLNILSNDLLTDKPFIDFLYSKEVPTIDNVPFKWISFDEMMKLYPDGYYIPQNVRDEKLEKLKTKNKKCESTCDLLATPFEKVI